jgi:hypothetical protein
MEEAARPSGESANASSTAITLDVGGETVIIKQHIGNTFLILGYIKEDCKCQRW